MAITVRLQGDEYEGVAIFRPTITGRDGSKKNAKTWYVRFHDHTGKRHEMPSSFAQKRQALTLARRVADLVHYRRVVSTPIATLPPDLEPYFNDAPPIVLRCLQRWDILAAPAAPEKPRTLSDDIDEFEASLVAKGTKSASERARYSREILKGFETWGEVDPHEVARRIGELPLSGSTKNHYRRGLLQFGRYMSRKMGTLSPFDGRIDKAKELPTKVRRALSEEEIAALLAATLRGPKRCGLVGPERALFYRMAIETGLRLNELAALKVANLNLADPDRASVRIDARSTKNATVATLPILADTATALGALTRNRLPNASAFSCARTLRGAEMLSEDLEAARVPVETPEGIVDFHALRTTCATRLFRAGVHPREAQALMRHSTIVLTMETYTRLGAESVREAVNELPRLGSAG